MKKIKNQRYRRAVFIVTYLRTLKGIKYLVLKRKLHWNGWEFVKGGVEKEESLEGAVKREIFEETGQVPVNIDKHNFFGRYKYNKKLSDRNYFIGQSFTLFSAELSEEKVKIDEREHSTYLWLPFSEAFKKLTFKNQKKSLQIVNNYLNELSKFRRVILNSGTEIFLGKDAKTNDSLLNQFKGKKNIILHTKAPGSPFCVIKKLNPLNDEIYSSGIIVARYSQNWRDNKSDVEVNVFTGMDINKNKKMKLGTWQVKNFKTIKVKKEDIENYIKNVN